MEDVQSHAPQVALNIDRVGVRDLKLPLLVRDRCQGKQQTVATVDLGVDLPSSFKGTHMSRFLEILMPWSQKPLAEQEMEQMLEEALTCLHAQSAEVELSFKYFVDKQAPVSGRASILDLDCLFTGRKRLGEPMTFQLGIDVPFTSLCPCSKEISAYGAHNQRSVSRVQLRFRRGIECIYIEDLALLLEKQGSSPIYPLLKREDEKYVTERAYENPKFVEDILRDTVLALRGLEGLAWFSIECENYESIHNHSAFASHEETLAEA